MIKSAKDYTVSDILKIEADLKYVIPKYQREYTWGKWQWEALFDDINENGKSHFIGSIICINQTKDSLDTDELELVDGQQRLTTISLLYAAIYDVLNKKEDELPMDKKVELFNLKRRLVLKKDDTLLRLEPSFQNDNYFDYLAVLKESSILGEAEYKRNAGNRKIFKSFRYFKNRLTETTTDDEGNIQPVFDTNQLFSLLDKIGSACLVKIEVYSHSSAFTLFESLNNRGVPLSAIDLIKNKLLAKLEKDNIDTLDKNFKKWNKFLQLLTDDYSTQERFLRHFYNGFKHLPEISIKGIPLATRSNLIQIFEKLIDADPKAIFDKLYNAAKEYNRIISPEHEDNSPILKEALQDLSRVGGAPSHVLLIYLIVAKKHLLNDEQLSKIINLLVKFFVRRHLTDTPPTRDLPRHFITIIEMAKGMDDGNVIYYAIRKSLITISVGDDEFAVKLKGNLYDENVGLTRFLLCKIEQDEQTRESSIDLWARNDKNKYIFTVEHIFPQGDNIPNDWINSIAGGDTEKAKKIQEDYVHTLGNLTLSGYNSKLSNMSFTKKRDRVDDKQKPIGYKNGLFLNEVLATKESWSVDDISERTEMIISKITSLFSFFDD
jgi:uncharacterized protein with ParB-like and HNH nuclease domain